MDIEVEIDGLYRLPLADFTAARNALAARLQKAGIGEGARVAKSLGKPSATAWATNQVYWNARPVFDRLVDAATRLREAVAQRASAAEARRAMQERSDALAAGVKEAENALVAAGHAVSPAVLRRVRANLEALAAGTSSMTFGRLAEDLQPPGLDVLAGLPVIEPPPPVVAPTPHVEAAAAAESVEALARRRDAEAGLAEAVRRLEAARTEALEAQRNLERAEARLREAGAAEAKARAALEATDVRPVQP
jgi:hypothetical protein